MKRAIIAFVLTALALTGAWAVDEGLRVGPLRLNIWGEVTGTYDDNVRLVVEDNEIQDRTIFEDQDGIFGTQKEDDIFYEGTLGLRIYRQTDGFLATLSGIYTARRYTDFDDLDNESINQEAEIVLGERTIDRFSLSVREAYRNVFDYEQAAYPDDFTNPDTTGLFLAEDRTERVSRQLLDLASILTWRVSDKLNSDYSVAYGTIDYDTETLYDWSDIKGQAEFDYRLTDKTAALLTGQYGQQESDSLVNVPDYYVVRGGLLSRTTDKLTFKGAVGVGEYDRFREREDDREDTDVAENVADVNDGSIDYVSYDIAGDWDLTQRTKFQLFARNAVQPAAQYTDNAKLVSVASAGISHRIFERFRLALTGSFRKDDYEDPVEVDTDVFMKQEDTILGGQIRLDYEPPKGFLNAYAEARYEDRNSTLPGEDYDQLRLTLGLKLKI